MNLSNFTLRSKISLGKVLLLTLITILLFFILDNLVTSILLVFLMPNLVFNPILRPITWIVLAAISISIAFLFRDIRFTREQKNVSGIKRFLPLGLFVLLMLVLMGGRLLCIRVQADDDKRWFEDHDVEFTVIKHDEIEESRVERSARKIQETLEGFRNQYQSSKSGTPLRELHLYANHDSFTQQTMSDNNTAAFFDPSGPSIYMPADLYFMQPEAILHETMHAFMYEILGGKFREIPLWFHDGYAQYFSMNWLDLIDKRVQTKLFLWDNKPNDLQAIDFLLNRYVYPTDSTKKDLFYKSSFAFVDFLESTTGNKFYVQVLKDMLNGRSFNVAVNERAGISLHSIYFDWVTLSTGLELSIK